MTVRIELILFALRSSQHYGDAHLHSTVQAEPPAEISVEVDYMYTYDHIHRLFQEEIDAIDQMFACHVTTTEIHTRVDDDAVRRAAGNV